MFYFVRKITMGRVEESTPSGLRQPKCDQTVIKKSRKGEILLGNSKGKDRRLT